VFEAAYKLPELAELEKFVKTNRHLPEIPTAKQMVENGVNLGELNIKLLQKVEELTLHLIELSKKVEAQDAYIKTLNKRWNNSAVYLLEVSKPMPFLNFNPKPIKSYENFNVLGTLAFSKCRLGSNSACNYR
jgi:hypothetical protein